MNKINWGIIGTGNIAHQFASALVTLSDAKLYAVTSRQQATAVSFAQEFNIEHSYDELSSMLAEADLDVVYIATPHPQHYEQAKACILAGKSVLCEKPMTLNKVQSCELVALAKQHQVFLMEAMMIPMFPAIQALQDLIARGDIGTLKSIHAGMGFNSPRDWQSRVFNPELAGGALLDVGIYPLTFAHILANDSLTDISSQVEKAETGVDLQSVVNLGYQSGVIASLSNSIGHFIPCVAMVMGDKAMVEIPHFSYAPTELIIKDQMGTITNTLSFDNSQGAYYLEAQHVHHCLRNGLLESPLVPHQQTLAILEMMDTLRAQWQLIYPGE
ncbi:Gfo/Idh/MocA family protein [Motilimonas cestriensis]|uniref:Gfo/Idh/MocA family protein n=1 Tax=Motilimonas cestriensis TaxID=2742685 RepID=UPI003DA2DD1A